MRIIDTGEEELVCPSCGARQIINIGGNISEVICDCGNRWRPMGGWESDRRELSKKK